MVAEYAEPTAPLYSIVHQSIQYQVVRQQCSTRTLTATTIEAKEDGVDHFSFTRSHPLGRLVERVGLTIGPGADLDELTCHSGKHLRYRLKLDRSLAAGDRQKLGMATELQGIAVPVTAFVNTIDQDSHPVELTEVFATTTQRRCGGFLICRLTPCPACCLRHGVWCQTGRGGLRGSSKEPSRAWRNGMGWGW